MSAKQNAGFSLVEILVTIVILMVGLLGLAGLQGWAMTSQMEGYQRSQALILLQDIQDRMIANRNNASLYVGVWGGASACPATTGTTVGEDLNEWCEALKGAAEIQSGAGNVGAMIGARGCITHTIAMVPGGGVASEYLIEVAWQGLNSTAVPGSACGKNQYGSNDALRRVVSLPFTLADLN